MSTAETSEQTKTPRHVGPFGRTLFLSWVHLAVLWSFGFAQPLFSVLEGDPAFFVARGNTSGDILLLAFGLVLVPPTGLVLLEALVWRAPAVRAFLHTVFVGVLGALFALQVLADAAPAASSVILIPLSLAVGAAFALAYASTTLVPTALTVLGPAPLVFLALFLLFSDVSKLVLPQDEGTASAAVGSETPVIFVLFDEFSGEDMHDARGRLDATRFPNFASFAADATWYRNATTVADQTTRAVPSMLTGNRAPGDKIPIASDYPDNLFAALQGRYRLDVHETASQLCPESVCERDRQPFEPRIRALAKDLRTVSLRRLLPNDLADDLPAVNRTFGDFSGTGGAVVNGDTVAGADTSVPSARGQTFDSYVRGIGATPASSVLHFMHIQLPHVPWQYLPTGQLYPDNGLDVPGLGTDEIWTRDSSQVRQAEQRYLLQTGYMDRLIGSLMKRLKEVGMYERSLIVVTADHGVSFRPGLPRRRVTRQNFPDLASVPLFIKPPGQTRGRIVNSHAETIDVLPTVADYLDLKLPWRTEGQSLRNRRGGTAAVVRVRDPNGRLWQSSFARYVAMRDAAVRRRSLLFGTDDGGAGIYGAGPDRDLLGGTLGSVRSVASGAARADLDAAQSYQSVDPDGRVIPALVSGTLSGVPAGTRVAVLLNGRIRSVAPAFSADSVVRFAALVPPSAFRKGANRVGLATIAGVAGARRFAPVTVNTESFRLSGDGDDRVIVSSTGHQIRVTKGAVTGFVELLDLRNGGVSTRGWAADLDQGPADRILVFAGDRLVAAVRPDKTREDVAADRGKKTLRAGFEFSSNLGVDAAGISSDDIHVYGVYKDTATELSRVPGLD